MVNAMGLRKWMGLRKPKVKPPRPPMNALLWRRAEESAADFVDRHLQRAILFESREPLCQFVIDEAPKDGLLLEFGVFKGASINRFARLRREAGNQRKIWGFVPQSVTTPFPLGNMTTPVATIWGADPSPSTQGNHHRPLTEAITCL